MIKGIYENIWITPYPLIQISEIFITKKLNCHDTADIKGIISKENLLAYRETADSNMTISLYFEQEGEQQLLFCGFLEQMTVYEVGEHREVKMQLVGLTKALDRKTNLLDYQKTDKTMYHITDQMMEKYNNLIYEYGFENYQIEQFLLQYEETDYEFLKRVLSKKAHPIYTVFMGKSAKICFGRCDLREQAESMEADYEILFDKELCEEEVCYRIKSVEFWNIGAKVSAFGKELLVKEAHYKLKDGISQNEYLLCRKEGFLIPEQYHAKLVGISLDGTISKCLRDKVKVELDITPKIGESDERWFPYSSVAASSDGSGWYCMPEEGERIRLFCPTQKEEEAYVVSAIRSGKEAGDGSALGEGQQKQPENKELSNKEGQSVLFTEEGTILTCAGAATMVELKKDGTITIYAQKDIDICSLQNVCIRAENGIALSAGEKLSFVNEAGSSFSMDKDIKIHANRIKNNC